MSDPERKPVPLSEPGLLREACYIDGSWRWAASGKTFPVHDPADGALIAAVPDMGADETREAIDAAARAFVEWRALTGKARAVLLRRWHELILQHQEDLALLMTAEQGKPLAESRGEIAYGASFIEWFAEEGKRLYGDVIPSHGPDKRILVFKQPVGVAAAITPWNFPMAMITRKCAPALAAGCTVVVKPAEETPLSALALAVLAERAGLPPGVLNIVTGEPRAVGGELTANPKVRKLSFTGSTEVGKLLYGQCAGNGEEDLAGARRQCPVHRPRRRRPRRRGRRRPRLQVPQLRADLRLRQPLPDRRRHLRRLYQPLRPGRLRLAGRPRNQARRDPGAADQPTGAGEGRAPGRRRDKPRVRASSSAAAATPSAAPSSSRRCWPT